MESGRNRVVWALGSLSQELIMGLLKSIDNGLTLSKSKWEHLPGIQEIHSPGCVQGGLNEHDYSRNHIFKM